uniref:Tetraspanin 8 n=1 Tax=Buteo japonicus TaxID=224669 RepID=A0A8C0BUI0_9AVES
MAGVSSCMKYSMFVFNFLFWVSKLVFKLLLELNIDSSLFAGVDLLIAVGSIIMVLGFLGCCGAIKESRCMLLLFFIGLLLILILQVTGGILGAVYRSQEISPLLFLSAPLLTPLEVQITTFFLMSPFLPFLQNECCGLLNGPADWGKNFNAVFGGNKVCACELEDRPTDLCTTFQGRYVYKTVRKTQCSTHLSVSLYGNLGSMHTKKNTKEKRSGKLAQNSFIFRMLVVQNLPICT